jgi:hypothetical protein
MKRDIQNYINKLKNENEKRSEKMNSGCSEYEHTVLVHTYNNTLEIIKNLEDIVRWHS